MVVAIRARITQLRSLVRQRLGFSQAELRDVDAEQAFLRTLIGGGILAYASYVGLSEVELSRSMRLMLVAASMPLAAGLWMLWWFRHHEHRPAAMRYFAICADLIPLTVGLWGADEHGVPLIGFYLWVTVGNGFRFGPRMLMFSYWLSILCFLALLVFGPFWVLHRAIGVGFGLILATIPLYVLVLLSRLTAQKDAALELSNAKSRFVANVSHELRTPLTGVYAVYDLLRRRRLAPDDRALIGSLGSAITTLKGSVDAVLQMSKLEAGAEHTAPRLFNLRYFLQRISSLVQPQAFAKNLVWSLDVDPMVPTTAYGDPSHLQHVLGNLLNNALKFTPSGSVTLRVGRSGGGIRFEVIDTGIGIALEKQETLFDRFVQADATATRRYGGTGLGTSIAHDLVKLMGGQISLNSALGRGSTFSFVLPIAVPPDTGPTVISTSRKLVVVVGYPSNERGAVEETIAAIGLQPRGCDPTNTDRSLLEAKDCFATILVLSAADASAYTDSMLRGRPSEVSPWLVVAAGYTSTQGAALLRSGAVGLLPPTQGIEGLQQVLCGLANSSSIFDVDDEDVSLQKAPSAYKILLADDNHSNQLLLARILTDAGHTVVTVERGDEAFDRMAVGDIDMAFLDLNMPEMSGPDVVKLFRAGESGTEHQLPIVVLSADATAAAQEESLAAGANDYLTKPVTAANLLSTIERVMVGASVRHQSVVEADSAKFDSDKSKSYVDATHPPIMSFGSHGSELSAPNLIDTDRIDSLRRIANNDRDFLRRYVEAAFDDLEDAIRDLRRSVADGDERRARDALHKIDGTGASIGANALVACAKSMRNYVTMSLDSDAAAALAEIATSCALTKSAVAALLHDARASNRPD